MSTNLSIAILTSLGIAFLLAEILLPGAIVGTIGTLLILVATYLTSKQYGMLPGAILFIGSTSFCALAFYVFFRSPARKLLVHEDHLPAGQEPVDFQIGQRGTSLSPLRPTGRAVFVLHGAEKQVDVSANAEFIDSDQPIQISRIEGSRIFVSRT